MTERRLSSRLTIVRKVMIPIIWLAGAGYGVVVLALKRAPMAFAILLMLAVGLLVFRQFWFPLRTLFAAQDGLVISSLGGAIRVPYSQIEDVRQQDWFGVTEVVLKDPTALGCAPSGWGPRAKRCLAY